MTPNSKSIREVSDLLGWSPASLINALTPIQNNQAKINKTKYEKPLYVASPPYLKENNKHTIEKDVDTCIISLRNQFNFNFNLNLNNCNDEDSDDGIEYLSTQLGYEHDAAQGDCKSSSCDSNDGANNIPSDVDRIKELRLVDAPMSTVTQPFTANIKADVIEASQCHSVGNCVNVSTKNDVVPNNSQRYIDAADLEETLPNGWTLFNHQKEAIRHCLTLEKSILAYDMGLGKTIIGLKAASAICTSKINCILVVIAPCTLMENWKREGESIGFQLVRPSTSNKQQCASRTNPYDIAGQLNTSVKLRMLIVSWSKIPTAKELDSLCQCYFIVADEAHAMQNMLSIRTKSALALIRSNSCVGCILATGTPMKNGRPANLFPLLYAIKHPITNNKIEYEKRYCDAKKTLFNPWDVNGASNLKELRSRVEGHILRKTKEECLQDLPRITRKRVEVETSTVSMNSYREIMKMHEADRQRSKKSGSHVDKQTLQKAGELLGKLRQCCSLAKVDGTCNYILSHFNLMFNVNTTNPGDSKRKYLVASHTGQLISRDNPIVIFVWYKETAIQIRNQIHDLEYEASKQHTTSETCSSHGRLVCCALTGDIVQQKERQTIVDNFQNGLIDVLVCTYGVGATGITLTASHTVILHDRPWTPGDVKQAEDRICRIGQKSSIVSSIWITGGDAFPVDDKLDALLQNKDKHCEIVLNKHNKELSGSKSTLVFQTDPSTNIYSGSSNTAGLKPESEKKVSILSYFENKPRASSTTGDEMDSNLDLNVIECEEELNEKRNNIMKQLLKELL